jgi:NAD(P)-dependent dehydrogenase (short-subunit alcohol dehydrogenase family)
VSDPHLHAPQFSKEPIVKDYFGYKGKQVVVTGAASGMGAAAAEMLVDLGADVYALDVRPVTLPVKKYIAVDLLKKDSIDAAVAKLPAKIDNVFNCAGIAGAKYRGASFTETDVVTINFLAARHLIERLIPRMPRGGAIAIIASVAGSGWRDAVATAMPLLETKGFDEGRAWLDAHKDDEAVIAFSGQGYALSKQCLILYAKLRAYELAARGIRINTLSPGSTQTGMSADFEALFGPEANMSIVSPIGRVATAEEMGKPLVFLNSDMASYVSGADLQVDYGFMGNMDSGGGPLPPLEG